MSDSIAGARPTAFFDVDGVLVKPWVIKHFPAFLARQAVPLFDPAALKLMDTQLQTYRLDHDYRKLAYAWVTTYAQGLSGKSLDAIADMADRFWAEQWADVVFPFSERVVGMLAQGCDVVAISGSPSESLRPLCHRLGIHHLEATEIEARHGIYTGKVLVNRALEEAKSEAVARYQAGGSKDGLWAQTFGFGDTEQDKPLLQSVGSPYLVSDCSTPARCRQAQLTFDRLSAEIPRLGWLRLPDDAAAIPHTIQERIRSITR